MIWLVAAIVAPLLQGIANVLDNYLANRLFKNLWTLTFYSTLLNVAFLPLILVFQVPALPSLELLPFFFLIGLIQVFYLVPYYKALQKAETSVVTALFSLGRIFVPVLAFLLVGEVLYPIQYAGFLMVIAASVALSFNGKSGFRFDTSFFYMLLCSLILAVEVVVYKYLFESVSWSTGLVWPLVFSLFIALSFLLVPKLSKDIITSRKVFKTNFRLFASEELLTFLGFAASLYAISLAPVTIVKGIGSLQALFVLLFALAFYRLFPRVFREGIDHRSLLKKSVCFALMILGVFLTLQGGVV